MTTAVLFRDRQKICRMLMAASSVAALSLTGAAFAADEIVVTAQFREQSLQDTPIAITAVTGEEIETKALSDISDIAAAAPNVTISKAAASFNGVAAYIRGVGQYDPNFALEPGVGMYIDDIYHGVMVGSLFDLLDLDRVEILRGPQGTLAGKNSIGGAIKLFSRKPEGDNSGYISATYGSYDRIEVRGAYDVKITDNAFFRMSAFSKRRDGHVKRLDFRCDRPSEVLPSDTFPNQVTPDGCKIGTLGGVKSWGLRGALRLTPHEDLEVNIFASIVRDDSESPGLEQFAALDPRFLPNRDYTYYGTYTSIPGFSTEPLMTTHMESIGGQIDWEISDNLKITSITGYENIEAVSTVDLDGGPTGELLTYNTTPYHQVTQELRLNGEFGEGLVEWTLGGFYFDSLGNVAGRVYSFPALNWLQDDPVSNNSKSVFAHAILHPVSEMSLIGGIRYTDDKKTYMFSRINPDTGLPADVVGVLEGVGGTYTGDSVDYRVGLDYRFSDGLMAYAQFSTGYKGGGINPRPFIPTQVVPFSSEQVNAYEVGFKSDFADGAVRLNVAAFFNKYDDIILIDTNGYPGGPTDPGWFPLSAVPFNAGKADIKGVEAETTVEPAPGLTLQGSISYLDFEYKSLDPNATASGISSDFVSPFTPEWQWSVNASYEFALSSGATITPQFYAEYQSSIYTDAVNAPSNFIEGRTTANANIAFRTADEGWTAILGVTNIADKHYYTNAFDLLNINGTASKVVARPREFFIKVRKNF
ncbi:TonB-dependent receptor [Hyphococcus luteus]|nr:TonB-dependent receptor [Marinicaulis flavus]